MISLVMQRLDNSITTYTKRGLFGKRRMVSKQGHGEPNPTWIPAGHKATRRVAEKIDGVAGGTWGELFNIPLTAHFLGGAASATSPSTASSTPISGCTATRRCTWWTARRSRRTSVSIHR